MRSFALAVLALCVVGDTMYLVDNNKVVGPSEFSTLYRVDLENKTSEVIFSKLNSTGSYVSGSVLCGSLYWVVDFEILNPNEVIVIDVEKKEVVAQFTPGPLYHNMRCDPNNPNGVIAVGSVSGKPAQFTLRKIDVSSQTDTEIGKFPSYTWKGWDCNFRWVDDEIWSAWTIGDPSLSEDGVLVKMGLDGSVKSQTKYTSGAGSPFAIFPLTSKDTEFSGIMWRNDEEQHFWAQLQVDGDEVKISNFHEIKHFGAGMPVPRCGNKLYSPELENTHHILHSFDVKTGAIIDEWDLREILNNDKADAGALAVVCA